MLNKKKANQPRQITDEDKKEIDKINNMEFFDAIDYLKKRKK